MLAGNFLLGLLTVLVTSLAAHGLAADLFAFSPESGHQDQAALHTVVTHSPPTNMTMMSGGVLRSFGVSAPGDCGADSAKQCPLILDFHGRGGNQRGQWDNSQYFLNAAGQNYVVIYPNGCFGAVDDGGPLERAWQGAPYANTLCNDTLFVSDLIGFAEKHYSIDSTRIYASGKSNGGGFVDTLACSPTGDLFAAFAMASAALYTDNATNPYPCNVSSPRMVLESHGTKDRVIPIAGRKDGSTPNISQWIGRWPGRNGCPDAEPTLANQSWGISTTYSCQNLPNSIQQYMVTGLGHCWPSLRTNTDTRGQDCDVHSLDYTQAVVDFFATNPKAL